MFMAAQVQELKCQTALLRRAQQGRLSTTCPVQAGVWSECLLLLDPNFAQCTSACSGLLYDIKVVGMVNTLCHRTDQRND